MSSYSAVTVKNMVGKQKKGRGEKGENVIVFQVRNSLVMEG